VDDPAGTPASVKLPANRLFGLAPFVCQGRLTLSSGNPAYSPQPKTPSATDTGADTTDFAADHGWTTGTMVTPSATGGGLTAGTIYFINATDANTVSYHTTLANAEAASSKVDLTASITAEIRPFGVGRTTVYFAPYQGDKVALYDGTRWKYYEFTERSVAVPATTVTPFDVFLYDNAGTLTLETTNWTNDTTRATALTTQNGVYVKSGATTRRYLGTGRTIGTSGQCELSLQPPAGTTPKLFLWNYYHRLPWSFRAIEDADSWTYTTDAWRSANNDTTNRLELVLGVGESMLFATAVGQMGNSASAVNASAGIGLDATTTNHAQITDGVTQVANGFAVTFAYYRGVPAAGYHFLQWLERSDAVGTTTWSGDSGVSWIQHGIFGEVAC
jgi:hypothetical protein